MVGDGQGIPLGRHSPSPNEVTLIAKTLQAEAVPRPGPGRPKNPPSLSHDKVVDSRPLPGPQTLSLKRLHAKTTRLCRFTNALAKAFQTASETRMITKNRKEDGRTSSDAFTTRSIPCPAATPAASIWPSWTARA